TWEGVIGAIDKGLKPHIKHLKRPVTKEDIVKLTEIRIKRISKFDLDKAQQYIESLEEKIAETKHHLENLVTYAINYFKELKKKYGKGRERKSEIRIFDDIEATKVVIRNTKLYVNREEGFIGTSLRRDEYVTDCSDIDDIIVFTKSGQMMVTKVDSKTFVGKNIIHVAVFKKKDARTTYNMIYKDGRGGSSYVKRFNVTGVTRDKIYDLSGGKAGSDVHYFSANPNGEAEVVTVHLRQSGSIKKLKWELDFADVMIKGRGSKGNIVTKYSVKRIELKEKGISTLKPRKLWFDDTVQRLNIDSRGELLGEFTGEDRLLIISQKGDVRTVIPEITMRFKDDMIVLEKWKPNKPISVIHFDGDKERYYVKRFLIEKEERVENVITDHAKSHMELVSTDWRPLVELEFVKPRGKDAKPNLQVDIEQFIVVKGIKAQGNQLTSDKVKNINILDPLPFEEPAEHDTRDIEVVDEESVGSEDKSADSKPKKAKPTKAVKKDDESKSSEGQTTLF
ncbi:MAG: DNA gyrase/topoisomerase IV subunit A, partial [Flavobacteriaceae bacterium]